jgi:hypothetical protein
MRGILKKPPYLICGILYDRLGLSATSNVRVVYIIEVLGSRKQYEAGATRTSKKCRRSWPRPPAPSPCTCVSAQSVNCPSSDGPLAVHIGRADCSPRGRGAFDPHVL